MLLFYHSLSEQVRWLKRYGTNQKTNMIQRLDLLCLAESLRARGFEHYEIYAELCTVSQISHFEKIESVDVRTLGGIAISGMKNRQRYHFTTTDLSTAGMKRALDGKGNVTSRTVVPVELREVSHPEKFLALTEFYRSLGSEKNRRFPVLEYRDELRQFQVLTSDDASPRFGSDERAVLQLRWRSQENGRKFLTQEWFRRDINELLRDLRLRPEMRNAYFQEQDPPVRWPLPSGEIPTVFSSLAFAKLLLPLVRSTEADSFLARDYLLEGAGRLPDWLTLIDRPGPRDAVDFQGVARKPTVLLDRGRFGELACDRDLALDLGRPPTGHARRDSFASPVGVGLWNVELSPGEEPRPLLDSLGDGIQIEDIDLLSWQPATATCRVLIKEGRLVHRGELGEYLSPETLDIPLPATLHHSRRGSRALTSGFSIVKPQGTYVMELSTPDQLCESVRYTGSVPASHYW